MFGKLHQRDSVVHILTKIIRDPPGQLLLTAVAGEENGSPGMRALVDAGVRADFAIVGEVTERIDDDQVNGIGGALSDSTIRGLFIHHTKVGLWFDGPMSNVRVTRTVIADQNADGLNFHSGVTDSLVRDVTALRAIVPSHREVLFEMYYRGGNGEETAAALKVPVGTIKSRVYRALRMLRAELEQQGVLT